MGLRARSWRRRTLLSATVFRARWDAAPVVLAVQLMAPIAIPKHACALHPPCDLGRSVALYHYAGLLPAWRFPSFTYWHAPSLVPVWRWPRSAPSPPLNPSSQ